MTILLCIVFHRWTLCLLAFQRVCDTYWCLFHYICSHFLDFFLLSTTCLKEYQRDHRMKQLCALTLASLHPHVTALLCRADSIPPQTQEYLRRPLSTQQGIVESDNVVLRNTIVTLKISILSCSQGSYYFDKTHYLMVDK